MKPGEHPDFYQMAPPPGTSRESAILLDASGTFWHEGHKVEHPRLAKAMATWVSRHPDNHRPILTNGYDWCYLRVEGALYFVNAVELGDSEITLHISDDTVERAPRCPLEVDEEGMLWARIKAGRERARFTRHSQLAMGPTLLEQNGGMEVVLPRERFFISPALR